MTYSRKEIIRAYRHYLLYLTEKSLPHGRRNESRLDEAIFSDFKGDFDSSRSVREYLLSKANQISISSLRKSMALKVVISKATFNRRIPSIAEMN